MRILRLRLRSLPFLPGAATIRISHPDGDTTMPRNAGDPVLQHLNEEQREARKRYLAANPPVDELTVPPTTAGWPQVQDWLDAGEPREG